MFHRLLQEIRLTKFDVFVKFGSCIQLNAPDMPGFPPVRDEGIKNNTSSTNNYGVVMTATIHDKHIDKISSLVNDCRLLCSPLLVPCVRNSFLIKSADTWERNGDNLLFGQEFVLQVYIFNFSFFQVYTVKNECSKININVYEVHTYTNYEI